MVVHTQKAAISLNAAPKLATHGRRGTKRSKHFTQFLTCRTTPQKVQGSTHNAKSSYPSRLRKDPQLHLAAEMARHPAAPGLLFTAAAVQGFSVVSKVVSNIVDKELWRAEALGTAVNRQLQQASNSVVLQAEVSQTSFQEWKGLMNGILSEEASKVQAELDHASKTTASWQQHSSEAIAQVRDGLSSKPELKAHPLGLPRVKVSDLQSGWLVDALQERFPQAGSPSAWPTSFSVAAGSDSSSDSMSFSDDEDRRAASSPNFASRFMDQARDLTTQLPDAARSRATALDRNMSEFGSAASDLATSVMFKAAQLPGQGFGISNFSPRSSPKRASSKMGQTGPSRRRHLSGPASFTARLSSPEEALTLPPSSAPAAASPSPDKAAALPTKAAASTASLPTKASASTTSLLTAAASSPAAMPPSAPATQPASPHMASPARRPATQKGAASPSQLSPGKAMIKPSAGSPLVKTANSRQSIPQPPASPGKPSSAKLAGKTQALGSPTSSVAKHKVSSSPTQPSQLPRPSANAISHAAKPIRARDMPTALTGTAEASAMPSASHVAGTAAAPASNEPNSTVGSPSPAAAAGTQGFSRRTASSAEPSGGAAAQFASTAMVGGQGALTPPVSSARPPVSTMGDVPQAKAGVPQATGNVPQPKGEGVQHMASAQGPTATDGDTKPGWQQEQQPVSATQAAHADLPSSDPAVAAPQGSDQRQEQPKAKTSVKPVRVVRPVPTPNWRAPRPLTPPPTPVQQGHPLSGPPAQGAYSQTDPGQQGAFPADSAGPSQDSAATLAASVGVLSNEDSSAIDGKEAVKGSAVGSSSVSGNAPAIQTSEHSTDAKQPQVLAGSNSGAAEKAEHSTSPRHQPTTTAAAATAVDRDTTTTVIDSIPWGTSGTATAKGRQVPPQTDGGGGSSTGGTTGGGGGGSHRPSGDSGGDDGGHRSSSTWQQWCLGLLLVGGGATAVSMSSAAKAAFMNAVAAIKARLAPVKKEEQQQEQGEMQEEEEMHEEEEEDKVVQDDTQAEVKSHQEDGIATNVKVKEGDTVWSIAEEYSGGGTAWPEVVSSNPHANTGKPATGMTLRVSVRL